jgi:polysaccharide pyruvyl transferase WcaK-like protein
MRVALINDTSLTNNPGCRYTIENLVRIFQLNGYQVIHRFPFGFGYELCEDSLLSRIPKQLNTIKSRILFKRFRRLISDAVIANIEGVIVNGEGSIHDGSIAEFLILELCRFFKDLGKKVILVNCTLQNLTFRSLRILKNDVDYLCVREMRSMVYLAQNHIKAQLGSDALFLDESFKRVESSHHRQRKMCVYTPGVLSRKMSFREIENQLEYYKNHNYQLIYLPVELEDLVHISNALDFGMEIAPFPTQSKGELVDLLSSANVVLSGRYHIAIMTIMIGIPIVFQSSNTWKIEGLLEFFRNLENNINEIEKRQQVPFLAPQSRVTDLRKLAELNCPSLP